MIEAIVFLTVQEILAADARTLSDAFIVHDSTVLESTVEGKRDEGKDD